MSVRAGSMTGLCVVAAGLAVAGCGGSDSTARPACSAPGTKLSLGVLVRPAGAHTWRNSAAVRPGGELQYRLEVSDVASNQATGTLVGVRLGNGEHAIPATTYMQSLGVADSNGDPAPPGLFTDRLSLGPVSGCGSAIAILYDTRAGSRSYRETASLRWNGGSAQSGVPVTVR
jgi:hypothetical protein